MTIYVVEATPNPGCQEVHIKYVQDQFPAACAFANVSPVPLPTVTTSGNTATATNSFTITNSGTDPMQFNIVSPAFQGQVKETWTGPTVANPTLSAAAFVYSYAGPPAYNSTDNYSITTSPFTRSIPTTMPDVGSPNATSFTLQVRWTFKKTEPALLASPLQKLCIAYRIQSEPGTTKFCNLVGQSVTTNNPNACD